MIVIPFTHSDLTFKTVPIVSASIVLISLLVIIFSVGKLGVDPKKMESAKAEYVNYYLSHPYLNLQSEYVEGITPFARKVYFTHKEWVAWYDESPDRAFMWIRSWRNTSSFAAKPNPNAQNPFAEAFLTPAGPRSDDKWRLNPIDYKSDTTKLGVLRRYQQAKADPHTIAREQGVLDSHWANIVAIEEDSLHHKLGYTPASPSTLTLFTFQFFHANIVQLLLNMLIFWVAAASIEDTWGRLVFAGLFVFFSAIGAAFYHIQNPEQLIPLAGSAVPVAGIMGAFVIRFMKSQVKFAYLYYVPAVPFKMGVWKLNAFFLVPVWFFLQLIYALIFGFEQVYIVAQYCAFATGMAVALIFDLTRFEERVLGREYEIASSNTGESLIAFAGGASSAYVATGTQGTESKKPAPVSSEQPQSRAPSMPTQSVSTGNAASMVQRITPGIHANHPAETQRDSAMSSQNSVDTDLASASFEPGQEGHSARTSMYPGGYLRTAPSRASHFETRTQENARPSISPGGYSFTASGGGLKKGARRRNKSADSQPAERRSPSTATGAETMPASSPATQPHPTPTHSPATPPGTIRSSLLQKITSDSLRIYLSRNAQLNIPTRDITGLALAQIENVETPLGNRMHFEGANRQQLIVFALVREEPDDTPEHNFIFIVDSERLNFQELLPPALQRDSRSENIFLLFEYLCQICPRSLIHRARVSRSPEGIPLFSSFESLVQSIKQ